MYQLPPIKRRQAHRSNQKIFAHSFNVCSNCNKLLLPLEACDCFPVLAPTSERGMAFFCGVIFGIAIAVVVLNVALSF